MRIISRHSLVQKLKNSYNRRFLKTLPHLAIERRNPQGDFMRHYEVVYLVHPDRSEQVQGMNERYKAIIAKHNGAIHREEDWGRRQLAYPIDDVHKAHYILMNIECNQEALDELKHAFKFNDAVIRHLILSQKNAITAESVQLSQMKKERETRAS